ncbi:SDR family NAD(P)-dependent oxidoreductase [Marivita hallyeonensis]|uniref:NAD(P)-dependent dehydrogenase, short-chain alcohol dehydrogenase family n=1 Tax=Marivita hallyeonensis TaxID=996342 RepID=A0A1M5QIM3_9RHOB|nr:SDR family oxidoreductase [Marivita hallyeonensis]SHH13373.1 NAD(P)-dependent dehydrogenase, short-chain alcohol dehydrogenase family [Marivita hallyeonensis]
MSSYATFHDLKGASVFITGGGSGIGAALTDGFLGQGAKVAFVGRSDASEFVATMADKHGTESLFIQCDITDTTALQAAIAQASEAHGPITALVNNAANDKRHEALDVDPEFWDWSLSINLDAYFFACQAVIPGMQSAGGGAIVNFSSISYMMGNAGYIAYTTSNAGITGMTRSLAREFGPDNIRINALAPGWVLTPKQKELWADPASLAAHLEKQCLKEHLVEQDVVDATLFLASKTSRMMTGQTLAVDGGVVTVAA